jgi:hypothetical protein
MPVGFADNVGIGTSSSGGIGGSLSPKRAVKTIKDILASDQFRDGVRLFAIGAAVSASKVVFDAILTTFKRLFIGEATFRGRDEAFRWMLLLMISQPSFRKSPRAVEISSRPTLLVDLGADYRGEINEDEAKATWASVSGKESDDLEDRSSSYSLKQKTDEEENDGSLGVHFFPATGESVSFRFEGVRFWASRERQLVGDESWDETIKLSYLSRSTTPLRKLVKHAQEQYKQRSRGRVTIHRLDKYGNWYEAAGIAKRSVESVHLPTNVKERLLGDAKYFLSPQTRQWYGDRGIPYRRGYILYGQPGSGKSSLVHVLASETDKPIYTLNLAAGSLDDETFLERMGQVPSGALVLMEDVDAAFIDRTASEDAKASHAKAKRGGGVSFSTLLNALDGVGAVEGRLLCMTTNHVDKLDPALIRPGRIDLRFEFRNASQEQAKELFLRWYLPRSSSTPSSLIEKDAHPEPVRADEIRAFANEFARQILPHTVSVAAIQGFLLSCGTDHQKAAQEIGTWQREQLGDNVGS